MKDVDFKDKSAPRIFGRGVVIVIVVLFSSLSFVLGYFVGRLGREDGSAVAGRPLETAAAPVDNPALQPAMPPVPAQTNSAPPEQSQAVSPGNPNQPSSQANPPAALPRETTGYGVPQEMQDKTPMPAVKEQPKEAPRGNTKDGSRESKSLTPRPKETSKDLYTVQMGALKSGTEAKKLKKKFEKKGYKTYLSVTKNSKHEKIYKIRVGEFEEKKEAEVLALKLKKAEGLNTFVTVKN